MTANFKIYLAPGFDKKLAPIPATKLRDWWEDNQKTANHAKHCLPLQMMNSLGYYILSPGTFIVKWNGDLYTPAQIVDVEKSSHYEVDNHSAFGSFTIQPKFIPITEHPGDFVIIKGIPNERGLPYSCMEAAIEAWWSVANFGIVFLLNQPGEFMIRIGQPIAQLFCYDGSYGHTALSLLDGFPDGHQDWQNRRSRPEYSKDLEYMKGKTSTGQQIDSHITSWAMAHKFENKGV